AREASRRAACENNLRQIGIACQNHLAALRAFPTGGWDWWAPPTYVGGKPATGGQQGAGWAFQILPFLEESNVWQGSGANDQQLAINAIGAPHSVYFCPSRRSPETVTYSDPYYMGGLQITHALCDYAGSNHEGTGVIRRYQGIA